MTLRAFVVLVVLLPLVSSNVAVLNNISNSDNNTTGIILSHIDIQKTTSSNTDTIPCDNSHPCSIQDGLSCVHNSCSCVYPNLTLSLEKRKCVANVGQQCGFYMEFKNASMVSCPDNSVCALFNTGVEEKGSHKCSCIYTHYLKESTGECVPLPHFGESCNNSRKCNPDSDLSCINGRCECQFKKDQFYDDQGKKCVSYAGGNCSRNCVPNSVCDFWGSGTCQCRIDHRINSERNCEPIPPGYLSPCLGKNELCNKDAGLKCIDKVCQCHNPLHQIYDFQTDKCIGLAGDLCDPAIKENCIQNTNCVKSSDIHKCQCKQGYSTTPFRKCMKSHKEDCSNEFCNVYRGLACINGTCQCYDSFLKYDSNAEACLSSVGSPCGKIFVPFPGDWIKNTCPECDSYYFACHPGTTCTRDFSQGSITDIGALEKFRCQKEKT